jgi:dTDP-4-dehydrorhamnose reductase
MRSRSRPPHAWLESRSNYNQISFDWTTSFLSDALIITGETPPSQSLYGTTAAWNVPGSGSAFFDRRPGPLGHNGKVGNDRVAIFGSGGQLGTELTAEFTRRGYRVSGFARSQVDITDALQVEQCLARADPGVVLNAAAYNQVDVAEKEPQAAFLVNGLAVRNLALACRQMDARLVHFSTDYVFDGLAGRACTEQDVPRPLSAYAVSKLAGEFYARAYLDNVLVIRTCGVYGPGGLDTARGNFVEMMLRLASKAHTADHIFQPIRVVEDHVASPTFAPALASRTADLVERDAQGLFHIGGGTPITWFDWAVKIFAAAGVDPPLKPTSEREFRTAARRPKYSALSNAKMESLGIAPMPALDEAIHLYMLARSRKMTADRA